MLLLLDNYDSFTYNVYQLLAELGADVEVIRHDQTTVPEIEAKQYAGIVISPGPGVPRDAGISEDVIRELGGRVPILGICYGAQLMMHLLGGTVEKAPVREYGKIEVNVDTNSKLFTNVSPKTICWMSHNDYISKQAPGFEICA